MMSVIFWFRRWRRLETFVVLFLLALLVSELVVVLLLALGPGATLTRILGGVASWFAGGLAVCGWWVYRIVGPMLFPLLLLTGVEAYALVRLIKLKRNGYAVSEPEAQYKMLEIVETAAPGFGFIGTCLSLISTMYHMDPNLDQTAMLKTLLDNSASAFGSTVYGMSLGIAAFISLSLFKNFLIRCQSPGVESENK